MKATCFIKETQCQKVLYTLYLGVMKISSRLKLHGYKIYDFGPEVI